MPLQDTLNTTSHMQRKINAFTVNDIKIKCIDSFPEWSDHTVNDLVISRFHAGIMNYVFKVTSLKKSCLSDIVFRIFDFDPKSTIDRKREDEAFEQAGKLGLGPKMLVKSTKFATNVSNILLWCRIEEYLFNDDFTRDCFFNRELVVNIGHFLGNFHLKMSDKFPNWDKVTELEKCLNSWYNECISFPDHSKIFDCDELKLEISAYLEELHRRIATNNYAYKTVVSHNDILGFNILLHKNKNAVTILDLEFIGYNHAGYDLANFIAASHLIFGKPDVFPFLSIDTQMVYPEDLTRALATSYLNTLGVSWDEQFLNTFICDLKFLEVGWWLNRIFFIASRSLKDDDQHRKDILAEFSRIINKTYYYKKNDGILKNYFKY